MGIEVKHSGSPAPLAVASYGGGKAKREIQDTRVATQLGERRKDRKFRAEQNMARSFEADRDLDRRKELFDYQQQAGRDDFDYELSAKQRAEYNKYADAYDDAVSSGLYDAGELADMKKQIVAKQAGIEPMLRARKKSPWPKDQDVGQTWTSKDGKFLLSRDDKGNIKKVAETHAQPTYKDRIDAWKQAVELSRSGLEQTVDSEKARAFYKEIMGTDEQSDSESDYGERGETPAPIGPYANGGKPREFKSVKEAEAANLPTGTWVKVGNKIGQVQ